MAKPNILITCPMSREYVAKLNADPRVNKAQQLPRETWPIFAEIYNGGAKAAAGGPRGMGPSFEEADIIICQGLPHGSVKWAPRLKWVQEWGTGIEYLAGSGVFEAGISVTNLAGTAAVPIAEHVLMMMLMLSRNAKTFMENAHKRQWRPTPPLVEVFNKTVGVVGLGGIGGRVAEVCHALGMRVLATRRTATLRQRDVQGVDELLPPADLPYLLQESDFVVLSCPLTKETEGLIGEKELRAMKPTAFLINIARGRVVDEPVLKLALKEGWIAGAGLDVFWNEPLEPESELWHLPNVVLTPHRAGNEGLRVAEAFAIFDDNLDRFLSSRPLTNLVDPSLGY
ncbi:MAG: D-2-hydroxyacid dehydrogenase [Dehalococcoidia bacterium]|nr:D-2-hydroxyacid dehydrogenase [Dehalococcoidia bacterium]